MTREEAARLVDAILAGRSYGSFSAGMEVTIRAVDGAIEHRSFDGNFGQEERKRLTRAEAIGFFLRLHIDYAAAEKRLR